tara:strand:+ start:1961 stop:2713 length:753 start_codon:yes stop_codon:yes gene_type:complete
MELNKQLKSFAPINLKQMDRVKLLRRTDTKYLISKKRVSDLLPLLAQDYFILEIDGNRIASYHTAYLDTPEKTYYKHHHQGRNKRHKVRFRNYVESGLSFLEVKLKDKGKTNKKRIMSIQKNSLDVAQKGFLKEWIPDDLEQLQTSLENTFQRVTLVHKIEQERVTIDFNLNFVLKNQTIPLGEQVIIEIKQSRVNRNSVISKLLRSNLIRPFRLSKYCIGSILMDEGLKYNRFKSNLLKINQIQNVWNS